VLYNLEYGCTVAVDDWKALKDGEEVTVKWGGVRKARCLRAYKK
jgi:hypothetical protein